MNRNLQRWLLGGVIAVLILAIAGSALLRSRRAQADREEAQRIGAEWQQTGMLAQADYVRVRELGHAADKGPLSDADVDWLLTTLTKTSSTIAHARILTVLSTLGHPAASQKQRIQQAITPLLQSRDLLERRSAERVQSRLALAR
jgi:hypothetical protein